jgi:phosphoserine phosphatase RsbU/P
MDVTPPALRDPVRDPARLAAVRDSGLLDTPAEESFDRLARVARIALRVPTALVTVVDQDRAYWKAMATEEEPEGHARSAEETPVEESFCRHVVRSGRALVVEDVTTHPVTAGTATPRGLDIVAWAGVPLRSPDGHVIGTFCASDTRPREWTADDLELLRSLADAASDELRLRATVRRASAFARTLQRSLLPPRLPTIEGLDVAGAFRPAGDGFGVLGDFYDVFETQPERWFLALGDVRGHGPPAAETVASARWTIRAAAARSPHPAAVLEAVNKQLALRDDPDAPHLTAVLLTVSTVRDGDALHVVLSNAGHPPALLRRAPRPVGHEPGEVQVEHLTPGGQPLGIFDEVGLSTTPLVLHPGDALVLVTDGVLETVDAQSRLLGEAGLAERLRTAPPDLDAQTLARLTVEVAREHQDGQLRDDVAVLVLRHPG